MESTMDRSLDFMRGLADNIDNPEKGRHIGRLLRECGIELRLADCWTRLGARHDGGFAYEWYQVLRKYVQTRYLVDLDAFDPDEALYVAIVYEAQHASAHELAERREMVAGA